MGLRFVSIITVGDQPVLAAMREIAALMNIKSSHTRTYFMRSPDPSLGGRCPIEAWLDDRDGDHAQVRALAAAYGGQT